MIATDRLRKAMHEMAAQKGDFTLFALFKPANAVGGKWDLVVSAPWLEAGRLASISEVVDLLVKSMGRKALQQFARVETVPADILLKNVPVDDRERWIQSAELFGMQMDEAIILRAKRPERVRPRSKVAHSAVSGSARRRA
jgi:hypothetical protein